jgi:uncharacterized membrane protein
MDPTHLHLLLNHVPTVGFGIGIALFALALLTRSEDLKQASLVVMVAIALVSIPTYATGNAAQMNLEERGEVSDGTTESMVTLSLIQTHEGAAFLALGFMELTGMLAWLALWKLRRTSILSWGMGGTILVLSLLTLGLMAQAANLGGLINHPEIRGTEEATSFIGHFGRAVGDYVRDTPWTWIAAETLHFIGLSLLIGVILLIDLRVLGFMPQVPFKALDRLLPWAMLGFALNVFTGMLFFAAAYGQYTNNPAFFWKLIFVLLAGANTLYFTFDHSWANQPGRDASMISKAAAVSAMVLWVGVMYWGSMLPFIGNAF